MVYLKECAPRLRSSIRVIIISSLSDDRSTASSKMIPPLNVI